MSNTSRRRITKSRRRVTLAAGVILAGAAIPIATAGTAWADDDTITVAQAEKDAKAGDPVEISVNGKVIRDTCDGECSANSGAVGEHNRAIAIGDNSVAVVTDATDSKATATSGGTAAVENLGGTGTLSNDTATASGRGTAIVENAGGLGDLTHDVATASAGGSSLVHNYNDGGAVMYDTAHASNEGLATITNDALGADTHDTVNASGANSIAGIEDASNSSNVVNDHETWTISNSDTHWVNGKSVDPQVAIIPLTEPHEMHVMPSMPMP
jgi:hypothetical protein